MLRKFQHQRPNRPHRTITGDVQLKVLRWHQHYWRQTNGSYHALIERTSFPAQALLLFSDRCHSANARVQLKANVRNASKILMARKPFRAHCLLVRKIFYRNTHLFCTQLESNPKLWTDGHCRQHCFRDKMLTKSSGVLDTLCDIHCWKIFSCLYF